jgi:hypothetical protein
MTTICMSESDFFPGKEAPKQLFLIAMSKAAA